MNKKLINLSMAAVLLGGPAIGYSATLDTVSADGVLQNFTGFDWHSNGGGWVQGFDLTGANMQGDSDTFTLTYQAFAGVINTTSPTNNLYVAAPGSQNGTYEVTTFQTLTQTATCANDGCSSIDITTNSGSWRIFLDSSPDANQSTGTGFLDGVNILSGTWDSGFSTFSATGAIPGPAVLGTGGGFLFGTVTFTNNTYVNPALAGTQFQASLQFPGQSAPSYTRPAAFDGVATGADTASSFVIQTDGSQGFTHGEVPEPGILALMGIGLLGFAFTGRRRT
ncbi:flocculation-associated PEP-CTERM protein PepA [Nitrosospira multiformis]|uniref:flocculation-associated PEP-CTERM protein PepA n=1 Tax=Nitrosospira multiformis TaxID=1231 RepID=UPI00089AC2A0|nr:flocculation-associated PEP-CTERM protein PepA [Nitrosospira multiformis]SDZ75502.1 PEP-CTERM protein-sorting domain-containing protein [Nitrosospira multiformis]